MRRRVDYSGFGAAFRLGLGRRDGAEHVAAHLAVRPCAGVFAAVDHHVRAEGAQAGEGQVVERDDRRVAGPLDGDRHGQCHVAFAVLDPRGEHPQVALRHFPHRENGVRLRARRRLFADDGELAGQHGVGQRRFKLFEQPRLPGLGGFRLGLRFLGVDLGQAGDQHRDTQAPTN